jgi:hypothetical protein
MRSTASIVPPQSEIGLDHAAIGGDLAGVPSAIFAP